MDSVEEIESIVPRLKAAREAYYLLDPIISDLEFDALKERLKELDPFHEEIAAVGAETPSDSPWEKVAHEIPMGSLDKVNAKEEFLEWAKKTGAAEFLFTYKIDGSSLEIVYENGKLQRCVTRGDGNIGEDVTLNTVKIPDIPRTVNIKEKIIVRGEVVMMKQVFEEKYAEKYANPRNTAAGKIRDKKNKGEDCKNLNFLAFTIVYDDDPWMTEFAHFEVLKQTGFKIPFNMAGGLDVMAQWFEEVQETREEIAYEIDGIVIRVNNLAEQATLGEINMRPLGQIAWKFDPATSISKVQDVKWQVGPTGRITPVAIVEPVNIGGVTVTHVSLHNLSLFNDLKLFKGCEVLISRRNDVIPYIEKNLSSEAA